MTKNDEWAQRIPSWYVQEEYIQIMLTYQNNLLFFGNQNLINWRYLIEADIETGNTYLEDERRKHFPYSSIPEHKEKRFPFMKINFANQILDFEKPYIKVYNRMILQMTAFKDGTNAILHYKTLNEKAYNHRAATITREELELYLKTGFMKELEEEEFESIILFGMDGSIYSTQIESEEDWLEQEKVRLIRKIKSNREYNERTKIELQQAITLLEDCAPFRLTTNGMIKFKANGEMKIDYFNINYEQKGKYKIEMVNLPITIESLSRIKSQISTIKMSREPIINLRLNPHVTKEQLQEEKAKVKSFMQ